MKKIGTKTLAILLAVMMLLGALAGCDKKTEPDESPEANAAETSDTGGEKAPAGDASYPIDPEEFGSGDVKWSEEDTPDGWTQVENDGGKTLGYSKESGVELIQVDGLAFKDLNRNGKLDMYEDWRQDEDSRASDLASQLSAAECAGLVPHASQNNIDDEGEESRVMLEMGIRSLLSFATAYPVDTQAKWNNSVQEIAEGMDFGIPVNISTNPRTTPVWPDNLALAATFDPELVFEVSKGLSKEYRAIGISTLLGPQIDLATDPRWWRNSGTFGEDPALSRDMTDASVSGHQSTFDASGADLGWGTDSVNAMIKHWPGDGTGEGGRESHDWYGQFAVYPGGQFDTHLIPFVDGGLNPNSNAGSATGVMASYSIAWSDDESLGDYTGSAFNEYKIDMLRAYGFDGILCSDWGVTSDPNNEMMPGYTTGWGVEGTEAERSYQAIMAGCDQIGGRTNDVAPILEAYQMGVDEYGEEYMLNRFQESARRITKTFFQSGIFENAYVSVSDAKDIVGGEQATAEGFEAQVKSIVMLKNENDAIKAAEGSEKPTVYVPMVFTAASNSVFGKFPAMADLPIDRATLDDYFNVVTDTISETLTGDPDDEGNPTLAYTDIIRASADELAECDFAFVLVKNPQNIAGGMISGGYDPINDQFIPISIQYGPYTANSEGVRRESISGPLMDVEVSNVYGTQYVKEKRDCSYYGNSAWVSNGTDLDMVLYAADNMPEGANVIVAVNADYGLVVNEFEDRVDSILMGYTINPVAFLEIAAGRAEPSGLLPVQVPKDMEAVEAQLEDVPRDAVCHVDTAGNTYDFAFGLNWSGVIDDARTAKYGVPALVEPEAKPAG